MGSKLTTATSNSTDRRRRGGKTVASDTTRHNSVANRGTTSNSRMSKRSGGSARRGTTELTQPLVTQSGSRTRRWSPNTSSYSADFTQSTEYTTGSSVTTPLEMNGRTMDDTGVPMMVQTPHLLTPEEHGLSSSGSIVSPTNEIPLLSASNGINRKPPAAPTCQAEKDRRIIEAEKILEEIAKEYAAKRAAGLVPTKPVPARTLLWEEMARNARSNVAKRGQCVFGRDAGAICGCTTYKKKKPVSGYDNAGGVCECCNHGAAWHRLTGGSNLRSSRLRSINSSVRHSRLDSLLPSEARSSMYLYDDSEYDDDDDDEDLDDEAIANEVARPYSYYDDNGVPTSQPNSARGALVDRSSMFSNGSSFGFPSRLSSGATSLSALLLAIQRYREMGMSEEEIEVRIREDFPPQPRKSSLARMDSGVSSSGGRF